MGIEPFHPGVGQAAVERVEDAVPEEGRERPLIDERPDIRDGIGVL